MSRKRWWQTFIVFALFALILAGCSEKPTMNALDPKGTAGEIQFDLILLSVKIMSFVFIVVMSIFIFVLIKYRKRKDREHTPKDTHGNTLLEVVWTIIPIVLITILAIPTVKDTFKLADPPKGEDVLHVKVTGYQYWWEFEYPDLGIKTAQELHIPVGKKVQLEIHGKDVLHSFWVPSLAGKTDVIPGRVNYMWFDAKKPGVYQGKCAELCGAGHALMDFKVFADRPEDFEKWVAQMKKPPVVATADDQLGEKLFRQNCMGCHAGLNEKFKGPDLSKFGTRTTIAGYLPHDKEHLKKWLKNPQAVKPGALMPKIDYLSPQEMEALTNYLLNRK